jgi:hypothetical protein
MKVAWHEVPGIDPTKIRSEGYGVNSGREDAGLGNFPNQAE